MWSQLPCHGPEVITIGDVTIVRLTNSTMLDEHPIQTIIEELFSLTEDPDADDPRPWSRKLLLNLSGVQYLTSMALGQLILLNKKVLAIGGRLALCNCRPLTLDILQATNLRQLFTIYDEEEEALQRL